MVGEKMGMGRGVEWGDGRVGGLVGGNERRV